MFNKFFAHKIFIIILLSFLIFSLFSCTPKQNESFQYVGKNILVSERISTGADIVISTDKMDISSNADIKIKPEIEGDFVKSENDKTIVYHPKNALKVGMVYEISAKSDEKILKEYFQIIDAPKLVVLFPNQDTEADEKSKITAIFNEPIVPLTTLDEIDESKLPIEIFPVTKGKWKWIGTRTLQFQPETNLIRSSNYKIRLKKDFKTYDGFTLPEFEYQFKTRPIRNEYIEPSLSQSYSEPITVYFNQPFDLEKTKGHIKVKNNTLNQAVDFIAEYGKHSVWDEEKKKNIEEENQSILAIYQKVDKYNRPRFWNFSESYGVEIEKVVPQEGDIFLEEKLVLTRDINNIVSNIFPVSERASFQDFQMIDPKGYIEVDFYENIDLKKSIISSDKIKNIENIEECDSNKEIVYENNETVCDKILNKSKIKIFLNSDKIVLNESFKLKLEKIFNEKGLEMNVDPIEYDFKSAPKFEILKIVQDGSKSASTDNLIICSNTEIHVPQLTSDNEKVKPENIDDFLKVNLGYKFKEWGNSFYIYEGNLTDKCQPKQFQTYINYSLIPQSNYEITLNLIDVYEQKATTKVKFKTGDIDKSKLNFYNLQEKYSITTPEKTKLSFAVQAMDYIDMDICEIEPADMIEALSYRIYYTQKITDEFTCKSNTQKRLELPKFYFGLNYFQVDLKDYIDSKYGHFVIIFSHPDYKDYSGVKVYENVFVTLTNLSVIQKQVRVSEDEWTKNEGVILTDNQKKDLRNFYFVTDIKTLNPIFNAKVQTYEQLDPSNADNFSLGKEYYTNIDGLAETEITSNIIGTIVYGDNNDTAIIASDNTLSYANYAFNDKKIFVYTDRPIYRPGDVVNVKGIYRFGYEENYEFVKDKEINFSIQNSQYNQTFNATLKLNDFGTFETSFILDKSAPLGSYSILINDNNIYNFDVQEYVGAAFKIDSKTDKEEYMNGDTFNLDIQSDYYFGVPVKEGQLIYDITSQDYYFDKYQDEYFSFGSYWYDCYGYNGCSSGDKYILRGEAKLDASGHSLISKKIDFVKFFKDQKLKSKIFVVNYAITDSTGRQVAGQKSFIVHAGEFYLGLKTENEEFELKAKSVDVNGKPLSVDNLKATVNQVSYVTFQRKEVDGGFYYRSDKKLTPVQEIDLSTDSDGNASKKLSIKEQGEYEITIEGVDDSGNKISTTSNLYVGGKENVSEASNLVMPTNDTSLTLVNDKPNLNIGDEAGFIIKNPFTKPAKALIAIERGRIYKYEILDINTSFYNYKFKIDPSYLPNIYASVVLLSNDPVSVKYGQTSYSINIDSKELDVKVTTDKEKYLPGEEVNLNIEVKNNQGKPVSAEISIAVVDMSVLALKGNPHKNPVKFFYDSIPLTISTSANLKNLLHEIDIKTGKGGGGGADATKKRGIFKDTAYWIGTLKTDANGKAIVKFNLPDNLTTWQIESLGITKDTLTGINYKEIMTNKDLFITTLKPRFIVPGDEFEIGGKIFNQSGKFQKIKMNLVSDTLEIDDDSQSLKLDDKANQVVYFKVKAPSNISEGLHKFTISIKGDDYEDTVENTIPVIADTTYETVATANYSTESEAEFIYVPENVLGNKGSLKINTSATLALFLSDALNSILAYPYGCTEQIASKLDSIAIIKNGLNLKNIGDKFKVNEIVIDGKKYGMEDAVALSLSRIYQNQHDDGGFVYFQIWENSDFYLTLRMIQTLSNLQRAGFNIDESRINYAVNFVNEQIKLNPDNRYSSSDVILTMYVLTQVYGDNNDFVKELSPFLSEKIFGTDKFLNETIDNISLTNLALMLSRNPDFYSQEIKEKVYKALENRISIDARGAYLKLSDNTNWAYYETAEKDTALMLKAL